MDNSKIQQEVEKSLKSLDGLQKAEGNPFLYEKIRHRVQQRNERTIGITTISWKLAAAILLIITVNVLTCWHYQKEKSAQKNNYAEVKSGSDEYYYNTAYTY